MSITRRQFLKQSFITSACLAGDLQNIFASGDIDAFIKSSLDSQHISGITACTIKNDKMNWSKGYG